MSYAHASNGFFGHFALILTVLTPIGLVNGLLGAISDRVRQKMLNVASYFQFKCLECAFLRLSDHVRKNSVFNE